MEPKKTSKTFKRIFNKTTHRHLFKKKTRKVTNKIQQFMSKQEHTTIKINESQQFQTKYFHCLTDKAQNISQQIEPIEFTRLIREEKKPELPSVSLIKFYQALKNKTSEQKPQKLLTTDQILTKLHYWLQYYCQSCHKFVQKYHSHNQSKKMQSATILQERLMYLRVHSKQPCQEQESCVYHMQSKMKSQQEEYLEVIENYYYRSLEHFSHIEKKLEQFKCIINGDISYCMLKKLIWTGMTEEKDYQPSCLELYFIVRKILREAPMDVDPLDRQLNYTSMRRRRAVEYQLAKDDMEIVEVMPAKFYISRSQVCNGAGVFTRVPLKKNIYIGTYAGQLIDTMSNCSNKRSTYLGSIGLPSYNFQLDRQRDVDSCFYGNITRLLNHMSEKYANCAFKKNTENLSVEVYTIKDVTADQELFLDYGSQYNEPWKEQFDKKINQLYEARSMMEAKKMMNMVVFDVEDGEVSSQETVHKRKESFVARKSVLSTTQFVKKSSINPMQFDTIVIDD